jgi:DNA-binding IclR family transcriptional regulator
MTRGIFWGVVDFLKEVGWIKQDESGTYRITMKLLSLVQA